MLFTVGTGFYGKVATVNNQWIETKFFSVMFVPIFPMGSMYVTTSEFRKRRGFNIALHTKSIVAAYGRLVTGFLAALMFYLAYLASAYSYSVEKSHVVITYAILGLLFAAAWAYMCFYYGKAEPDEIAIRTKVGSVTGLYALPQWLEYSHFQNMLTAFMKEYHHKFPGSNWKNDLMHNTEDKQKHLLLFAIALCNCMVNDSAENDELYVKAERMYEPEPKEVLQKVTSQPAL